MLGKWIITNVAFVFVALVCVCVCLFICVFFFHVLASVILLMAEILYRLRYTKPYQKWDKLPTSTGSDGHPVSLREVNR